MVTRVINLLGPDVGDPADRIGPAPDNPAGFWESRTLISHNDELLAGLGGSWSAPPEFRGRWWGGSGTGRPGGVIAAILRIGLWGEWPVRLEGSAQLAAAALLASSAHAGRHLHRHRAKPDRDRRLASRPKRPRMDVFGRALGALYASPAREHAGPAGLRPLLPGLSRSTGRGRGSPVGVPRATGGLSVARPSTPCAPSSIRRCVTTSRTRSPMRNRSCCPPRLASSRCCSTSSAPTRVSLRRFRRRRAGPPGP